MIDRSTLYKGNGLAVSREGDLVAVLSDYQSPAELVRNIPC